MVYQEKLVVVVKTNGKILRERGDEVFLNFGSEYSLLLKNLHSRKASLKISIDGKDVLGDQSLLLLPNSEIELEGFLTGLKAKNKFKFIQKTKEIVEHRGDNIDDGIIRVEYIFEQEPAKITRSFINEYHYHYPSWYSYNSSQVFGSGDCGSSTNNIFNNSVKGLSAGMSVNQVSCNNINESFETPEINKDEGITVKGSEINQNFSYGYIGELDESTRNVIILKLKGKTDSGKEVEKPLVVKDKLMCNTCGKKNSSNHKFCSNCGTFLEQ